MPRAFLVKQKSKLDFAAAVVDEPRDKKCKDSTEGSETSCHTKTTLSEISNGSNVEQRSVTKPERTNSEEHGKLKSLPCLTIPRPFPEYNSNVLRSMLYKGPSLPINRETSATSSHHSINSPTPLLKASAHSAFDRVVPSVPRAKCSRLSPPPIMLQQNSFRMSHFSQPQIEQLRERSSSFRQRGEDMLKAELMDFHSKTAAKDQQLDSDEPLDLKIRHGDNSRPNSVESSISRETLSPPQNESDYIPKKKYFLDRQDIRMSIDHSLPSPSGRSDINEFALRTSRYIPYIPSMGDPRNHLNWAYAAYYQQASYKGPYTSSYPRVSRHVVPDDMQILHHSYQSLNAVVPISSSYKKDTSDASQAETSDNSSSKSPSFDASRTDHSPSSPKTGNLETHETNNQVKPPHRREYLVEHLKNIRSGIYQPQTSTTRPLARQPILGLEYIQNGNDVKFRDGTDNQDLQEEDDVDGQKIEAEDDLEELDATPMDDDEDADAQDMQDTEILPTDIINAIDTPGIGDQEKQMIRQTSVKPPQPKKYKCDICFKGFSRSNTLVTHKRIHTGDKPFKCELCGRAFRQPGNLTRHRLTHTTVKPYVCPQCDKAFNRASNLHTHMRTHTNYKPFTCPYCGKGFHQKIDMKIHSYTHTGEKPHKCKTCGRGFKQLTHLTYHMRTHSAVKMYSCAYCGKGFNQKGNLQAHIYGHTGERPYRCEICDKGFTLASTLNTHRRTHAEKKPFQCQYCQKDFYQKNALKSHLIASHPYTGESLL